jgi:hypothetical protein
VEDPVLPRQFLVGDVQKTKIHLPYPRRKNDASSCLSSLSGWSVLINRRMK